MYYLSVKEVSLGSSNYLNVNYQIDVKITQVYIQYLYQGDDVSFKTVFKFY